METIRAANRSSWWSALIGSSCLLVLLVVAIGVVAAEKTGKHGGPAVAGPSASAVIDPCLVGTWRTSDEQQQLVVSGVGAVTVIGSGVVLHIGPDGSDVVDYASASPYTGTANGHQLEIAIAGTVRGAIRTSDGTITFKDMSASGTVTATVDGTVATSIPLSPDSDPVSYTCSGDSATEHSTQYTVNLTRVSRLP